MDLPHGVHSAVKTRGMGESDSPSGLQPGIETPAPTIFSNHTGTAASMINGIPQPGAQKPQGESVTTSRSSTPMLLMLAVPPVIRTGSAPITPPVALSSPMAAPQPTFPARGKRSASTAEDIARDDEILLRSVTSISCTSSLGGGHSFHRNRSSSLSTPAVTARTAHAALGGTGSVLQPSNMGDVLTCTPVRTLPLRSCPPGCQDSILSAVPMTAEVIPAPRAVTPPSPAPSHCTWHTSSEVSPRCGAGEPPATATAATAVAAAAFALHDQGTGCMMMDIDGDGKQEEVTPRYAPSPAPVQVPAGLPATQQLQVPSLATVPGPALARARSISVHDATEEVIKRRREALHSALYLQPPSSVSPAFPALNQELPPALAQQATGSAAPEEVEITTPLPLPPLPLSNGGGLPAGTSAPAAAPFPPPHQRAASHGAPSSLNLNPLGPGLSIKLLPFSSDNGSEEGTGSSSARSTVLLSRLSGLSNACELLAAQSDGAGTPRTSRAYHHRGPFAPGGSHDTTSILGQFGGGNGTHHARAASNNIFDPSHPFTHPFLNTSSNGNLLAVPLSPLAAAPDAAGMSGPRGDVWGSGSGSGVTMGGAGVGPENGTGEADEEEEMEEPFTPTAAVAAAATESCSLLFRFLEQQPVAPAFPPPPSAGDLCGFGSHPPPAPPPALAPAGVDNSLAHNTAGTTLVPPAWGSCPVPAPPRSTSVLQGYPLFGTTSCLVHQPSLSADVSGQAQLMAAAQAVRQYRTASIASRDSAQFRDQVQVQL